jgi:hypothetical protein
LATCLALKNRNPPCIESCSIFCLLSRIVHVIFELSSSPLPLPDSTTAASPIHGAPWRFDKAEHLCQTFYEPHLTRFCQQNGRRWLPLEYTNSPRIRAGAGGSEAGKVRRLISRTFTERLVLAYRAPLHKPSHGGVEMGRVSVRQFAEVPRPRWQVLRWVKANTVKWK